MIAFRESSDAIVKFVNLIGLCS